VKPRRRQVLKGAMAIAASGVASSLVRAAVAQQRGTPRVIDVTARRFRFEPEEISLKTGERVVVAIRSLDFVHGMNIPALGLRTDLVPGRITRVELQPKAAGVIEFLCDNFCGDGHEQMHGRFVVTDRGPA
jgi:cytochrome c oxidase subunit 2